MEKPMGIVALPATLTLVTSPAVADSPARERELTCSDGSVFLGQQVRLRNGIPPRLSRNVDPGGSPTAFSFHAASVTTPDGTVVESETWDNASGVEQNHDLVVCSFVIPIGPLTGHTADFAGCSSRGRHDHARPTLPEGTLRHLPVTASPYGRQRPRWWACHHCDVRWADPRRPRAGRAGPSPRPPRGRCCATPATTRRSAI